MMTVDYRSSEQSTSTEVSVIEWAVGELSHIRQLASPVMSADFLM